MVVWKLPRAGKAEVLADGTPVIIQPSERRPSKVQKYVVIGVTVVLVIAFIVTCILVGLHFYYKAQIIQFTLKLDKERTQEVTSDTNNNYVSYHVNDSKHEAWVVDDFNKDIKVTKIISNSESVCYMTPLNRTAARAPGEVTKPDDTSDSTPTEHDSVIYVISGQPVSDTSFLNREARTMCDGISIYWMYPTCNRDSMTPKLNNTTGLDVSDHSPFYTLFYNMIEGFKYPCINGCCKTVCACQIYYSYQVVGNKMICSWITNKCCPGTDKCYSNNYCSPTNGLQCTSQCA